jgi:hypothetical protein
MQNGSSLKPITMMKYLSSKTNINYESCMNIAIWFDFENSQAFKKTK